MNEFSLTPEQLETLKKFVKGLGFSSLDHALMYTGDHIKEVDFGRWSPMLHMFIVTAVDQIRKVLNANN